MDRQEFRLLFERGDITLEEWVPVRARVRGVVNEEQTRALLEIFPGARLDVLKSFGGQERVAHGRHKKWDISQQIDLSYGLGDEKMRRYGELLRKVFADQMAWLGSRAHVRLINEQNGLDSLRLAAVASAMATSSGA
jgi:hypothetical protein